MCIIVRICTERRRDFHCCYFVDIALVHCCAGTHNRTHVLTERPYVSEWALLSRYFPTEVGPEGKVTFEGISVVLLSSQVCKGYRISVLELSKGSQTRKVEHFWFVAWPDHGVPTDKSHRMWVPPAIPAPSWRRTRLGDSLLVKSRILILCKQQHTSRFSNTYTSS